VIVTAQLIAQCCRETGRGEFLALPSRFASPSAVNLNLFPFGINLSPDEFHVLPDVEN
jgi:hypothetical protein